MRQPHMEFDTVEMRETGDSIDRNSVFKYRKIRRNNCGEIIEAGEWVTTKIPSRVEVRPMVLRYNTEGAAKAYEAAAK